MITEHQPHREVKIWARSKDVVKNYNIVAWFSGHKHNWNILEETEYGFVQVNIHSIGGVRDNFLSAFLSLKPKGDTAVQTTIRFRNHQVQKWIKVNDKDEISFSVNLDDSPNGKD